MLLHLCSLATLLAAVANAFVGPSVAFRKPTRVYLEDWVADMIDHELYRQGHKKEFEQEWMEKNRGAVMHQLSKDDETTPFMEDEQENFRQTLKDKKLAKSDPQRYCADRCITTGNCDVYEDIFEFSPEEVLEFCSDCVLATDEEGDADDCAIPDAFYDLDSLKP